mgnify:CR=1 FL=1|tara:strand:- start:737 stop:946 length:210 start_codon:yes stop_codon:yes gene_type:complete
MDKFQDIKDFIDKLEPDVIKFYSKGFSSTGTRVTVGMQHLKELAHALRDDVLATKKINKKAKENKAPWD